MTQQHKRHKRQIACVVGVTATLLSGLVAAAPTAASAAPHLVRAGESIQAALDAASPGDTVHVLPGTYRESVRITTSGVTLRGSGTKTVISPPAAADTSGPCAGHGICVVGTTTEDLTDVSIRSLTVTGFPQHGLWASRTDGLNVREVTARDNGVWGLAQQRSTRAVFRHNTATGNGDAGIFVANAIDAEGGATDTGGTLIADNRLSDNRIGITVRRVRNLTVRANEISANCAGLFIVGDESKPAAGAMSVLGNTVEKNNKLCPATPRLPAIQGSGIVLTGSEASVIRGNEVRDNIGSQPMSGGIVLVPSMVGATNTDNTIEHNDVRGNTTADLVHRGEGSGNTFTGNVCQSSEPAGMC